MSEYGFVELNTTELRGPAQNGVFECFAASNLIMWFWPDCANEEMCFAGVMMKALGYGPGDLERTQAAFSSLLHPDERPQLDAAFHRMVSQGLTGEYENQHRMRRKDGTYADVRATMSVVRPPGSRRVAAFGVMRVLDTQKEADISVLQVRHDALHSVLNRIGHAVVLLTSAGRVVEANEAAAQILECDVRSVAGRSARRFLQDEEGADVAAGFLAGVVQSGKPGERELWRFDRWWHAYLVPLPSLDYSESRVLLLAQDITAKKAEHVAQLAREKTLTRTLVREVHHRIKNHLQGLIGLLRTYGGSQLSSKEVVDGAVAQILSIATVHGLLSKEGQTSIEFGELVSQIIATLRVSSPVPVELSLQSDPWQPIALSQEEAVPLAIAIGELCTNAIKHTVLGPGAYVRGCLTSSNEEILLTLSNAPARLPATFDVGATGRASAGLDVVQALLPRGRSTLEVTQEGDTVVTRLHLRPTRSLV